MFRRPYSMKISPGAKRPHTSISTGRFRLATAIGCRQIGRLPYQAELEFETIDRPQLLTGSEGIMNLDTGRAPIGVQFFSSSGVTLRLATTYMDQEGDFSMDEFSPIVEMEDEAWITDLSVEYRLPKRRGIITLGVRNLFDEPMDLLEVDPLDPLVATKRFVFGKVSFVF